MTSREQAIVRERLAAYQREDATAQRNKLVAMWREHHPVAAAETSSVLKPLMLYHSRAPEDNPSEPDEIWLNDVYNVTLRRHKTDPCFGSKGGMIQLGICSLDGSARHDWRDFQAIKNQLAGAECEAFELYPAESRLLDPSNYYSLWCFPSIHWLHVGHRRREVLDADRALAPQRAFPVEAE